MDNKLTVAFAGLVGDALKGDNAMTAGNLAVHILETKALRSPDDQSALADAVKSLRGAQAKLVAELRKITSPLDEARDAATALAKPRLDQIKNAIDRAKVLDSTWRAEQERAARQRQIEEQRRAEEAAKEAAAAAEQDGYEAPPAAVEPPAAIPSVARGGVGKSYTRRVPVAEATDVAKIAAHPDFAYLLKFEASKAVSEFRVRVNQVGEERAVAEFAAAGIHVTFETSSVFA